MTLSGFYTICDGASGSGKDKHVSLLVKNLQNLRYTVVQTREPYKKEYVDALKELKKLKFDNPLNDALIHATMYTEDRRFHMEEVVIPNLEKGSVVISNRGYTTTCVIQSIQGLPFDLLMKMNSFVPQPNLIQIFDAPETVLDQRISRRGGEKGKFEFQTELTKKIRQGFLDLKTRLNNVEVIDTTESQEKVGKGVLEITLKYLKKWKGEK